MKTPATQFLDGLGIAEAPPRERMFNLELAQRWMLNPELQAIVPDPEDVVRLDAGRLKRFMEVVVDDPKASVALRTAVGSPR